MAYADYRLCDVCGRKAFYDADLSYEPVSSGGYRVAGEPQKGGHCLGRVGDWAVICEDCAKTHRTAILPIEEIAASQAAKKETKE